MFQSVTNILNKSFGSNKSISPEKPENKMPTKRPCKLCKGAGCCGLCDRDDAWDTMAYCSNLSQGRHLVHYSCDNLTPEIYRHMCRYYCPSCRLDNHKVTFYKDTSQSKKQEILSLLYSTEIGTEAIQDTPKVERIKSTKVNLIKVYPPPATDTESPVVINVNGNTPDISYINPNLDSVNNTNASPSNVNPENVNPCNVNGNESAPKPVHNVKSVPPQNATPCNVDCSESVPKPVDNANGLPPNNASHCNVDCSESVPKPVDNVNGSPPKNASHCNVNCDESASKSVENVKSDCPKIATPYLIMMRVFPNL